MGGVLAGGLTYATSKIGNTNKQANQANMQNNNQTANANQLNKTSEEAKINIPYSEFKKEIEREKDENSKTNLVPGSIVAGMLAASSLGAKTKYTKGALLGAGMLSLAYPLQKKRDGLRFKKMTRREKNNEIRRRAFERNETHPLALSIASGISLSRISDRLLHSSSSHDPSFLDAI
jgi:hypothetical protein